MVQSLQTSVMVKIAGVSLVLLLAACSSDSRYKHQINGNENYLHSPVLRSLQKPQGMILPVQNGEYDISVVTASGAVGKALDIRPPTQTILSGSPSQFDQETANKTGNRHLSVQSGRDDTGFPLLVVRVPFNTLWERLPNALTLLGMDVKDRNRSGGSLSVKYSQPSDSVWHELKVTPPGLAEGEYKLQLGNLENRSSLQFITPQGQRLTQSQNDALVAVFEAALNRGK